MSANFIKLTLLQDSESVFVNPLLITAVQEIKKYPSICTIHVMGGQAGGQTWELDHSCTEVMELIRNSSQHILKYD